LKTSSVLRCRARCLDTGECRAPHAFGSGRVNGDWNAGAFRGLDGQLQLVD